MFAYPASRVLYSQSEKALITVLFVAAGLLTIKKTSLNFKKQLESILMSKPDALVVLSSSFDSALLVRQAREARFEKPILGGNQFASLEFI